MHTSATLAPGSGCLAMKAAYRAHWLGLPVPLGTGAQQYGESSACSASRVRTHVSLWNSERSRRPDQGGSDLP